MADCIHYIEHESESVYDVFYPFGYAECTLCEEGLVLENCPNGCLFQEKPDEDKNEPVSLL